MINGTDCRHGNLLIAENLFCFRNRQLVIEPVAVFLKTFDEKLKLISADEGGFLVQLLKPFFIRFAYVILETRLFLHCPFMIQDVRKRPLKRVWTSSQLSIDARYWRWRILHNSEVWGGYSTNNIRDMRESCCC